MMCRCSRSQKVALTIGSFLASVHIIWALAIAVMPQTFQTFLDWIFGLHFLKPVYFITEFSLVKAIELTLLTFATGYLAAWLFIVIWRYIKVKEGGGVDRSLE